jgi:hypothetical protein
LHQSNLKPYVSSFLERKVYTTTLEEEQQPTTTKIERKKESRDDVYCTLLARIIQHLCTTFKARMSFGFGGGAFSNPV